MTTIVTRQPDQANRLAKELAARGHATEVFGCLMTTTAPAAAVISAGVATGVQSESMAGVDQGYPDSIEEAVGRYTRCRATRHPTSRPHR